MTDDSIEMSVRDMPEIDRAFDCALPLVFSSRELPEYPGIGGTCFLCRYKSELFVVSAWHAVKGTPSPEDLKIPAVFGKDLAALRLTDGCKPARSQLEDHEDVVILRVTGVPHLAEDVAPLSLEECAKMDGLREGAILAVRGYPKRDSSVDYDTLSIKLTAATLLGTYEGKHFGMHAMKVDTRDYGHDGFSGSPVLLCALCDDGSWKGGLAGMVIRGGPQRLYFIDSLMMVAHIHKCQQMLRDDLPGASGA